MVAGVAHQVACTTGIFPLYFWFPAGLLFFEGFHKIFRMSNIPSDLKYTSEHEWVKALGDGTVLVGITDHAQAELGDITFVELPSQGTRIVKGETFGVVESVKAASDLYAPITGEVLKVNSALDVAPDLVNRLPYSEGWMLQLKLTDAGQLDELLEPNAYKALLG